MLQYFGEDFLYFCSSNTSTCSFSWFTDMTSISHVTSK